MFLIKNKKEDNVLIFCVCSGVLYKYLDFVLLCHGLLLISIWILFCCVMGDIARITILSLSIPVCLNAV